MKENFEDLVSKLYRSKGQNPVYCSVCDNMLVPIMFDEEEMKYISHYRTYVKTGRVRHACSHLECPHCGKKVLVDDEYLAGPWVDKNERQKLIV